MKIRYSPMRVLAAMLLLLSTAGCAPAAKKAWVPAEAPYRAEKQMVSVDLPPGWMRWNTEGAVLATRDGIQLEYISVERWKVGDALKNTKKKLDPGMFPHEVAIAVYEEQSTFPAIASAELSENSPERFMEADGFRTSYRLKLKTGLVKKCASAGAMIGEWVYVAEYCAAARHYYDRNLEAFNAVVKSARTLQPPKSP